jgi:putative peptide zinc metalloprotease protein
MVLAMAAALAFAWWPNTDRYRPVRPYEGGTLIDLASVSLAAAGYEASAPPPPAEGGEMVTVLPRSAALPTEAEPQLALVLVPGDSAAGGDGQPESATGTTGPSWVFPFNEPLPPEPGDNQALTVNTTDNSVSYDVAMAMVWVTGEDPVLNVNEAYAFASCSDCVTVAVAFQVVLIVGRADVIVPQNLSGAVNYNCFQCISAAIASQLVVTVDSLPGVEQQIALVDLWEDVTAFAASIPTLPLADVIARLESYKEQIVTILGVAPLAPLAAPTMTPVPSESPARSATATPGVAPSADTSSGATPKPTVAPPSSSPTMTSPATPSPEATPTPTTSSTSEATMSPEPSLAPSAGLSPEPGPS